MKASNKILLPRDELERLYIEKNLSSDQIAFKFGCDGLTVIARLRDYGIPIKPRGWHKLVRRVPDFVLNSWPSSELACLDRKRRVWQNWVDLKRKAARE